MVKFYTNSNKVLHTPSSSSEIFDFGAVTKGFDTSLTVFIKGNNISEVNCRSTCGCTVAKPKKENGNLYSVDITYKDSHIQKPFAKNIKVHLNEDGVERTKTIKIKGIIK